VKCEPVIRRCRDKGTVSVVALRSTGISFRPAQAKDLNTGKVSSHCARWWDSGSRSLLRGYAPAGIQFGILRSFRKSARTVARSASTGEGRNIATLHLRFPNFAYVHFNPVPDLSHIRIHWLLSYKNATDTYFSRVARDVTVALGRRSQCYAASLQHHDPVASTFVLASLIGVKMTSTKLAPAGIVFRGPEVQVVRTAYGRPSHRKVTP